MARAQGVDSANSQFFIMLQPLLRLDGTYTALGRVIEGMSFVDAIQRGEPPANPSRIVRASIGADNVPPLSAAELRSEEHTSELQSLMRISYAVFCLKKKNTNKETNSLLSNT